MASRPPAPSTIGMVATTGTVDRPPSLLLGYEASHLPILAPMSVFVSAGLCPPGRPQKRGREAARGVSDPASRASGSAQARRAGSLTPRVISRSSGQTRPGSYPDRRPVACTDPDPDRAGRRARDRASHNVVPVGSRTDGRSPVAKKLLVRLKQIGDLTPVESTTRLGDWYGNILRIGRRQHLLFISERSRLPVVFPIRESKSPGHGVSGRSVRRLCIVGVAAADIADERSRMSKIVFGRTRNRSLLGPLNDFAFMAQSGDARQTEPESPEELMQFLAQTPILPLDGARPIDLTLGLFEQK